MCRCLSWLVLLVLVCTQPGCDRIDPLFEFDNEPKQTASERPAQPEPSGFVPPPPPQAVAEVEDEIDRPPATPQQRQATALDRIEELGEALEEYGRRHKEFPPAAICDPQSRPMLSWRVALLPVLDEQELYEEFHLDEPWDSPHNETLIRRMPEVFQSPGGPPPPKTCYLAPIGLGTVFSTTSGLPTAKLRHRLEDTLVLVEVNPDRAVVWTQPKDWRFIPLEPAAGLGALRQGKFLAVSGEASSYAIPADLEAEKLRAMFTYTGTERVNLARLMGRQANQPSEPGGADHADHAPPRVSPNEQFLDQAKTAMADGRETFAVKHLMADAVLRADPHVLDTLRWSPALKRPAFVVRWAVATLSKQTRSKPRDSRTPSRVRDGHTDDQFDRPARSKRDSEPAPPGSTPADAPRFWDEKVTRPMIERLKTRVGQNFFGQWFGQGWQTGAGRAGNGNDGVSRRMPGIVLLEADDMNRLRQLAVREGVDLLLVAAIHPRFSSGRVPAQTNLTLSIVEAVSGRELWQSKPLSNLRLANRKGVGGDPAAELVDSAMTAIDMRFRLIDVPDISPQAARQRAQALAAKRTDDPLPVLAELRYYQWKGLLTADELAEHYGSILGADFGSRLASGDESERRAILARFLPRK